MSDSSRGSGPGPSPPQRSESVHEHASLSGTANWIEEAVFGTLDGVITSLALAVSVAGVLHFSHYATFLTIVAAAIAGALSMTVGALLSARTRAHLIAAERGREEANIVAKPDEETRAIREIFERKGYTTEEVEILVRGTTRDRGRWADVLVRDGLGLTPESDPSPIRHGGVIGLSYLIGSIVLALPFLFDLGSVLRQLSVTLTVGGLELVIVGVLQARSAGTGRLRGAVEILLFGFGTALAVFLVTFLLQPSG